MIKLQVNALGKTERDASLVSLLPSAENTKFKKKKKGNILHLSLKVHRLKSYQKLLDKNLLLEHRSEMQHYSFLGNLNFPKIVFSMKFKNKIVLIPIHFTRSYIFQGFVDFV